MAVGTEHQKRLRLEAASVRLDSVTKRFGAVVAVDRVTLEIPAGRLVTLLGPSGCGKTTTLRMIAGLEWPTDGRLYIGEEDVTVLPAANRSVTMVFQAYALFPHLTVFENIAYGLNVQHMHKDEIKQKVDKVLSLVHLEGYGDRAPTQLSGGQQQRVALARALIMEPKVLLMDEPLSNLDAKLRVATRVEIKRLLHRFGITAIYVTHDQTEAITLGDRIAVMRAGKIEQLGTYNEIIANPVNAFVAGFLGLPPMNLLRGWEVTPDGELFSDLGRLPIPKALLNQVTVGQKVILGFHSEAGRIVPEGEDLPARVPHIKAEVINLEPDFAHHYQLVNVQAGKLIFGVRAPLDLRVGAGWPVNVLIPEEALYLFDEQSEARIVLPQ